MAEVTATAFKDAFEQVTQEQMEALLGNWWPPSKFTRFFEHNTVPRVADILGYSLVPEYPYMTQRIDFALTHRSGLGGNLSFSGKVVAAIEHENTFGGSHEEMLKLRNFRAPLGVLITYANRQKARIIREYAEILSQDAMQPRSKTDSEVLVIVGPYGKTPPAILNWEYFTYHRDKFQQIV